jgi:hypothetical protein
MTHPGVRRVIGRPIGGLVFTPPTPPEPPPPAEWVQFQPYSGAYLGGWAGDNTADPTKPPFPMVAVDEDQSAPGTNWPYAQHEGRYNLNWPGYNGRPGRLRVVVDYDDVDGPFEPVVLGDWYTGHGVEVYLTGEDWLSPEPRLLFHALDPAPFPNQFAEDAESPFFILDPTVRLTQDIRLETSDGDDTGMGWHAYVQVYASVPLPDQAHLVDVRFYAAAPTS